MPYPLYGYRRSAKSLVNNYHEENFEIVAGSIFLICLDVVWFKLDLPGGDGPNGNF
jgi:hypothetical protein